MTPKRSNQEKPEHEALTPTQQQHPNNTYQALKYALEMNPQDKRRSRKHDEQPRPSNFTIQHQSKSQKTPRQQNPSNNDNNPASIQTQQTPTTKANYNHTKTVRSHQVTQNPKTRQANETAQYPIYHNAAPIQMSTNDDTSKANYNHTKTTRTQ